MSLAMDTHMKTDSFALQTRLFVALKRSGRVVDMVWFQQNPEYARMVLGLADTLEDLDVSDAVLRLRTGLRDFLAVPKVAVLPVPSKPSVEVAPAVVPAAEPEPENRYVASLR